MRRFLTFLMAGALVFLAGCARRTPEQARAFVEKAEIELLAASNAANVAQWVQETYITGDTQALAASANEKQTAIQVRLAKQAAQFDGLSLPEDVKRKLLLIKLGITLPAPSDPKENAEVARLAASLSATYGKGKYCPAGPASKCLNIDEITKIMATSHDAKQLLDAWQGWHSISPPMRQDYARLIELANKGAKELGFADTGALWRSGYDMPPDDFSKELDRLWDQVKPLYVQLHAYTRWKLREKYGDIVPATGPIPAHLLGNIWAQTWDNLYPLLAPKDADPGYDLTAILKQRKTEPLQMVRYGEGFFKSLGFAPLPSTFWERSMFIRPRDRDVICHASAWDLDNVEDLRLKMCIDIVAEDFYTVHHELGHNFYQRAYDRQPFLFRGSANDGFHEAIGDTIALSITPAYLVQLGFIKQRPRRIQGHRPAAEEGSREDRLPALRPVDRPVALEGLLRPDSARKVQPGLVGSAPEIRGRSPPRPRAARSSSTPGAKYHVPATCPTSATSWPTCSSSSSTRR